MARLSATAFLLSLNLFLSLSRTRAAREGLRLVTGEVGQEVLSAGEGTELSAAAAFTAFQSRYGRTYSSAEELKVREQIFAQNWALIQSSNSANKPYRLDVNEFADMSWAEFQSRILSGGQDCSATKPTLSEAAAHRRPGLAVPTQKDWRLEGIVSPVKDQGHCGSCWAFSTVGALEAAYKQKYGKPGNFSEQQLLDCSQAFNNFACDGGLPSQAFEYVLYNHGLDTEAEYPYKAEQQPCSFDPAGVAVKVSDVVNITQYAEDELVAAVGLVRPTSVAFEVVNDFRFYSSGVYASEACSGDSQNVNHAVLAVAYDTTAEVPYYVIKNSWGAAWGESGFFKIKLGSNMCGIAACASYPVLA